MGKPTITGVFSVAMLNYQRVYWMGDRCSWFIRFIVLWCWPNRRTQKILKPCCSSKFPSGWWWGVPNHPLVYDNQEYNTRTTDTTDILSTVFGLCGWKMFIPPWPCIHLHYFIFSKTLDIILQEKTNMKCPSNTLGASNQVFLPNHTAWFEKRTTSATTTVDES